MSCLTYRRIVAIYIYVNVILLCTCTTQETEFRLSFCKERELTVHERDPTAGALFLRLLGFQAVWGKNLADQ